MRFDGQLSAWNDQQGIGSIRPKQGGDEVPVHISAFPRGQGSPKAGDLLSFEIELGPKGSKRASKIIRAPQATGDAQRARRPRVESPPGSSFVLRVVMLLIAIGVGAFGYNAYRENTAVLQGTSNAIVASESDMLLLKPPARCDGRTSCGQMTSCKEAKYFLQNCPGVKMDGNHDGVPCEQQWCTSIFSD